MYNLQLTVETKDQLEKLIALQTLGIVTGLIHSTLTIEDAEKILFNPYLLEKLEAQPVSQEILDLIHLGTELEDVESLLPEKLTNSLYELQQKSIKQLEQYKTNIFTERIVQVTKEI